MKNRTKITAIITATLLALTTTGCRPVAPSPEPTTTGGTDKLTTYYVTLANLQDVVSSLQGETTVIMTGQVTASDIQTISNIIAYSHSGINLNLKSVTGLTSLPVNGFVSCYTLLSVDLPDTVTSISGLAFSSCSLQSINIPKSVITIDSEAFDFCSVLLNVTFEDSSNWYITDNYSDWNNKINGVPIDVSNPETNATNFKGSLRNYYWYKN